MDLRQNTFNRYTWGRNALKTIIMLKKSYAMEEDWLCSNLFLQANPWMDEAVIHPPSKLHHRHLLLLPLHHHCLPSPYLQHYNQLTEFPPALPNHKWKPLLEPQQLRSSTPCNDSAKKQTNKKNKCYTLVVHDFNIYWRNFDMKSLFPTLNKYPQSTSSQMTAYEKLWQ